MEVWQRTSLILCLFGLLKELRPSESFITEYLIGFKNLTTEQVIHDIYPLCTYTILATSLVLFLVTDLLRYRPIIIFQGITFTLCWITLICVEQYGLLLSAQVLYGLAMSADVAYYTYIYAQVDREHYQKATSYAYTATLTGKFLASLSAQVLVSFHLMNFHELIYITLSCAVGAVFVSFFLPGVKQSMYFNRDVQHYPAGDEEEGGEQTKLSSPDLPIAVTAANGSVRRLSHSLSIGTASFLERLKRAYKFLWIDFKDAYSKTYVLKWSIWWAFAYAGNLQVISYTQPLWEAVDSYKETDIYNGAVGAIQCLFSAFLTFGVGYVKISWSKWGESFLCLTCILQGLVLIWMSQTHSLYTAYATYMMFRILYQLVVTIASSEVAHGITKDSCGLIFGLNTFLALVIQTILTIVVTDKRGLALDERTQFAVYGGYFVVLGILFFVIVIYTLCQTRCYTKGQIVEPEFKKPEASRLEEYDQPHEEDEEFEHENLTQAHVPETFARKDYPIHEIRRKWFLEGHGKVEL